ncbi:MAG TPA: endonuclease domain-containing protein [Mycobacteriales bacterium]|nr:endonuclease domain-containing protein [Mycobacteriales bacterium]
MFDESGALVAKACMDCAQVKPIDQFARNKRAKDGRTSYCKPCHNRRGKASVKANGGARNYHLRRRYGLEAGEVDAMVEAQGGKCAACKVKEPKHVDHDHETGEVRGVLCFTCNVALGNVGDDLATLQSLAAYLIRAGDGIVSVLQLECPRPEPKGSRAVLRDRTPAWS